MSTIKSSAENLTLNADGANNDVIIQSNGSTKVTVDGQNSRVGIGTTSPNAPLSVVASSNANAIRMYGRSDGYSELYGSSNDGSTNNAFLQVGTEQTKLYTLAAKPLLFGTNSTERVRIHSSGVMSVANGIELGSGLDATAANTLDDYEEGVHQYTITGSTSGSMTVRSGYSYLAYTKIGRVVHVQGRYETSGAHNAAGSLKFSLPFTAENLTDQAGVGGGFISLYRAGNVFNGLEARIYEGESFFYVFYQHASLDDEVVTGALVDSSIEGIFNFSYIAA